MNPNIIDQITHQAAIHFPREACGFILDIAGQPQLLPCENISHQPERSFLIEPMLFAQHSGHIKAVYHTHPNQKPTPSVADIASAERCGVPFLILSYPGSEIHTYTPSGMLPAPYEGRPFVYGVLDCLSLVIDYYRHEFGIEINDGERKRWEWWQDIDNFYEFVGGFKNQGFFEVDRPAVGDVVIMQVRGLCPNHAAIYCGDSVILHHPSEGNLSKFDMYGHYWRKNTVCFLRHTSRVNHEND